MNDTVEILTKVYGYVNRIKIKLSLGEIRGVWNLLNELSEYLVSVNVSIHCPDCKILVFEGEEIKFMCDVHQPKE